MASAADPGGQSALHYSRVAMWFHWIIAALVAINLFLGFYHEDFGRDTRAWMMFIHKATGMTILGLSIARLLWRLGHRPPPFDQALHPIEALLARITHWLFYVLMIVIPVSGWILSSTSDRPVDFFGLFEIGTLPVSRSEDTHEAFEEIHEILAKVMLGLIALHILGALKHHLQGHRHMIGRMGPWLYRQR
jgi:cytochrome b561